MRSLQSRCGECLYSYHPCSGDHRCEAVFDEVYVCNSPGLHKQLSDGKIDECQSYRTVQRSLEVGPCRSSGRFTRFR
jgi:hypothetical protein